jgi:hypothetical protein
VLAGELADVAAVEALEQLALETLLESIKKAGPEVRRLVGCPFAI